jgi:dolichyl-diphosphooligosaccharide--protein glycosyltransferase
MFILFFSTTAYTGYSSQVGPCISPGTAGALLDIKRIVPKHSAMFTPYWEYGYPLMEIGDFATYHDGGLQGGIRTTLAAKAMTSPSQKDMYSLLAYLEAHGFNQLSAQIQKENLSPEEMMKLVFSYPGEFTGENVYVLYLEEMIYKLGTMTQFGTWDFARRQGESLDFVNLDCFSIVDNVMTCRDGKIDLTRGLMNDGSVDIPLRAALFVNNGVVFRQENYPHESGYYLEVLLKDKKAFMILVADEQLFRTNFNQQYLLGNFDRRYFDEVYNNYPLARVLKVKKIGAASPAN